MEVPIPPDQAQYEPTQVLVGLNHATSPSKAREAIIGGLVTGFGDAQIKRNLRMTAITIYTHEKLAPYYHHRVLDGANTFVFFVCAAHGREAPSNDQKLSLPRVSEAQLLPLCHWESVYLALVAEIRSIYSEIQQNYETKLQNGNLVLHMYGHDGTKVDEPFTALDFASQLEEMWLLLMDVRLSGPLENAVRAETIAEDYRQRLGDERLRAHFQQDWNKLNPEEMEEARSNAEGLADPHMLADDQLEHILWEKYAPIMRRACIESLNIELDLPARRAQLCAIAQATVSPSKDLFCSCDERCQCRLACQFEIGSCACKDLRNQAARIIREQEQTKIKADQSTGPSKSPEATQNRGYLFGAVTNDLAQMQVAAMARPDPYLAEAWYQGSQAGKVMYAQELQKRRQRSDTENSDLAYVPTAPKTPLRGVKDAFPLGFYGSDSGQRYPKFRDTASQPPIYGSTFYTASPPVRKPVGSVSTLATSSSTGDSTGSKSPEYASTFASSSPEQEPLRASQVTYPSIPISTSKGMFTNSFPISASGNPREYDANFVGKDFATWDTSHVMTPKIPAKNVGAHSEAPGKSPLLRHSADSMVSSNRAPTPMVRSNTTDNTQLPLPDFIAPRPALKQRYVSAGGNARLQDRAEITGFALPPAADPGTAMSKEELMAKLANGEFSTPPRSNTDAIPRSSHEGAVAGGRDTADVGDVGRGEKRGRTSSNSSMRVLKRVFSRQNSNLE